MFILTGDQVPKKDWRSITALCFIFVLFRLMPVGIGNSYLRPDDFPEVWRLY